MSDTIAPTSVSDLSSGYGGALLTPLAEVKVWDFAARMPRDVRRQGEFHEDSDAPLASIEAQLKRVRSELIGGGTS